MYGSQLFIGHALKGVVLLWWLCCEGCSHSIDHGKAYRNLTPVSHRDLIFQFRSPSQKVIM